MTKIASMTPPIPRGTVIRKRVGVQPIDEAEHFFKCEACGGWIDMRRSSITKSPCRIRRAIKRSKPIAAPGAGSQCFHPLALS